MRLIDFRLVFYVMGLFLLGAAGFALIFALFCWLTASNNVFAFAASGAFTAFFGGLFAVTNRCPTQDLSLRQTFLLTALTWTVLPAFAGLPLYLSDLNLSYTDAYFEAVSGLTTTGSTVISGLERVDGELLLWRAFLQWSGGIGIIVIAIAVLPTLGIGGLQLFHTESSEASEKILPRIAEVARTFSAIYLALTIACAAGYAIAGMSLFDAIAYAMTTLSTGGYGTHDSSMASFGAGVHWVSIVFMLSGAVPFLLYVRLLRGNLRGTLDSNQVRVLLAIVLVATLSLAAWLVGRHEMAVGSAIRHAAFNVVSVITTTGYASTDYGSWGGFATSAFLILTVLGGCTGSTAGGIKMFRLIVLFNVTREQLIHAFSPHTVVPSKYDGAPIPTEVPSAVMGFTFIYFFSVIAMALLLSELGIDPLTAISSAATAIANVGPGLGTVVGPTGSFEPLPDAAKWLLSFGMVLGRLELFTVLVLFVPRFWKF